MIIRSMNSLDLPAVIDISQEGIDTGLATFETQVPEPDEFDKKFLPVCRLIAEQHGKILGWAMLSAVSVRKVYAGVAEVSVYVKCECRGKGIGSNLLKALIRASEEQGFWTLQASLFPENKVSFYLHRHAGFREVGKREKIARLHDEWRDTLLLERRSKLENGTPKKTSEKMIVIDQVRADERKKIISLLQKVGLPTQDLPDKLPHFFKASLLRQPTETLTEMGDLAGIVGLEIQESVALLRSLAVVPTYQSLKIGQKLMEKAVLYAREKGVNEVFLLTTTAEGYFEKYGFAKVNREAVPEAIRQMNQFKDTCPASAAIMHKSIAFVLDTLLPPPEPHNLTDFKPYP